MRDEAIDEIPAALGRVERVVGDGATGVVLAVRRPGGERVAVKVLRRALADEPEARARFAQEASVLRALDHPHVQRVIAQGELDDGRPYLVTPLLEGRTLADALADRSVPYDPAEAWSVLRALAEALEAAHARGVIHRDVKPTNVFLAREAAGERVVLMDFGLARPPRADAAVRTRTGAAMGTPAYMAPEQWWGDGVTPAVDQYGLGALAFELLTGRAPFTQQALPDLLQAHLGEAPPSVASVRGATVPAAVEAWVARCLAKEGAARFATMRALIDAGDAAFGVAAPRERPRALALVPLALACALAVTVGYGGERDPRAWAQLAGWGATPVALSALVGALSLALRGRLPLWPTAVTAALGSLGAATGFAAVELGLRRAPPTRAFELFNLGVGEANTNRFAAGILAAGLALGAMARDPAARRGPARDRRRMDLIALGALLLAALAALAGAGSAAVVALVACGAHALLPAAPASRAEALRAAALPLWAVALATSAALARLSGGAGQAWGSDADRVTRAATLTALAAEHRATVAVALAALAVAAGVGLARVRAAPPGTGAREALRGRVGAFALAALWLLAEGAIELRVSSRRAAVYGELAPQFALLARLEPPAAQGLRSPARAPSLRLARDVVAIDDARVGLLDALDHPVGRGALALDLSHRLARAPRDAQGPQLSLMIDRAVPWSAVERALSVAWGVGVRRAEVLCTRGRAGLALGPGAPPEASYVIPRDFGAVTVTLSAERGETAPGDARFGDIARAWPARGEVTLRVR